MAIWSPQAQQDMTELAKWESSRNIDLLRALINEFAENAPEGAESKTVFTDVGHPAAKLRLPVTAYVKVSQANVTRTITSVKQGVG